MSASPSYATQGAALHQAPVLLVRESTNLAQRFVLSRTNNCAVAP